MSACIFCQIVAGEAEAFVSGLSPSAVAFLDIIAPARGHSLVVPTRHVTDLLDGGADVLRNLVGTPSGAEDLDALHAELSR